ncbi:MAG: glycosyltransferase family 4 protein [Myxococcota bacterium]|nr:glycosyltransferase family 4 protein [Myxococcota bacterium]
MPLVVHPHFHPRRTGVTRHVETVLPALGRRMEAVTLGYGISRSLPRIGLRRLLRRARSGEVVWHAHRNNELLVGLLLRLFAPRLKVLLTRHSTSRPGRYTRWLARRADLLLALTPEVQRSLGLPSRIVPHGVELADFTPPTDRSEAWRALGLPGERGVGVIGRIRAEKGQGDFVAAIAPLLAQHPEWTPVLVGTVQPGDRPFAERLRRQLPSLLLPGEQSEIGRWYRGLTLFVHPSHREAYSMALLEAMASGCCVVASRLPPMEQVIDHGRTGFLFPPGDVEGLRAILRELLASPRRIEEVGRAAAAEAQERFGVEHEAGALIAAYQAAWSAQ